MSSRATTAVVVIACVPATFALALYFGSVDLGLTRWASALVGGGDEIARKIVWDLRAGRAAAAFACGALLALSGTLLQVLLRNPLADPGILGVSGGAAVGALAAILLGLPAAAVHGFAFAGASMAAGLLLLLCARFAAWDMERVLISGVGLAALTGAIVSLLLAIAPSMQLQGMLFWLLGDISAAPPSTPAWIVFAVAIVVAVAMGNGLDALALGGDKARSLGVPVTAVQLAAFICAAASTVAAVTLAGTVGFVGLAAPHMLRLAGIHAHRRLLPLAAAAGGSLVVLADTLGRTIVSPLELPAGAMLALLGAPLLLVLLYRGR